MNTTEHLASILPSALDETDAIRARLNGKRLMVFLDYDGTLTPIVARPELAMLGADMRTVVDGLSQVYPTAVISGRALDDLKQAVDLERPYYAGNHGLEIEGPPGSGVRRMQGETLLPRLAAVRDALEASLVGIAGILVEDKHLSLSVHVRNVDPAQVPEVEQAVEAALVGAPDLVRRDGKKVFEIRPAVDWDKGRAVLWLLQTLGLDHEAAAALYVGDDLTDEDAFRALRDSGRGFGVIVLETPRETAASYVLRGVDETRDFLQQLIAMAQPPSGSQDI